MKWISTRGNSTTTFESAVLSGLASDGGLYMPQYLPSLYPLPHDIQTFPETAAYILNTFLQDEFKPEIIKKIAHDALTFPLPVVQVGDYKILELHHGPTQAFKDIAALVLAGLLEHILKKNKKTLTILVATSGDTGGAVAQAFGGMNQIQVVIVFPKNKVSKYQEYQLTRVESNIYPIEVDGSFDDCQAFVKKAFQDKEFEKLNLSTANSINIGRLLPQLTYYGYIASLLKTNELHFVIPSGNMGNVTAGVMAKLCGFPIEYFTIACNTNDPLVDYLTTGKYRPKQSVQTFSNAMDIGNPSNVERLRYLFKDDIQLMRKDIEAFSITDVQTEETIKEVYSKYHYLLDPHTAVAWHAAKLSPRSSHNTVIVSTASPAKFAEEIYSHTSIKLRPESSLHAGKKKERKFKTSALYEEIKSILLSIHKDTHSV